MAVYLLLSLLLCAIPSQKHPVPIEVDAVDTDRRKTEKSSVCVIHMYIFKVTVQYYSKNGLNVFFNQNSPKYCTVLLERSKIGTVYNIAIYIIMYIQNIQNTVDLLDVLRINYGCSAYKLWMFCI